MQITDQLFYDVDAAAAALEYHPESIRRLIRQGQLLAYKIGNRYLIPRSVEADPLTVCPLCQKPAAADKPLTFAAPDGRYWHLECVNRLLAHAGLSATKPILGK